MEEKNNKISAFQFATITLLIMDGLFAIIGISIVFQTANQDAWIVNILSTIIGFIFIFILIKIMNYKPEKNILEKNKYVFGKIIGNIINLILVVYITFILIFTVWGNSNFVQTIYLTRTPNQFIALCFTLIAAYAAIKGIESIGRVSELFFFLSIIIVGLIVTSLFSQFHFDFLKPILAEGYKPIAKSVINYLTYAIPPLLALTIIPKANIKNNEKFQKYIVIGYLIGSLLMFFVFFLIPGVITPKLANLYRFPAYYVLRKVNLGEALNNLENFVSTHWFLNVFMLAAICMYFIYTYIKNTLKIKKEKTNNIIIIAIAVIIAFGFNLLYKNTAASLVFARDKACIYMGLTGLILLMTMFIMITIRSIKEKKAT